MPLSFVDKKKRWPPPKAVQYLLAVLALLAAIAVLAGWLYVRFIYTEPAVSDDEDNMSQVETELPDTAYCLIIIEDVGYERFALVETNPSGASVCVTGISPDLATDSGILSAVLQKYGAAKATQAVAASLSVPVSNFVAFSIVDTQNLFTKLGQNLQISLSEAVTYRDENGATVRLATDKRALTPKQITAVLKHTDWESEENRINVAADITAALINQCLMPKHSLKGYFELLANTAHTQLRIDNFNAYVTGLEHLASVNNGNLAQRTDPILPSTR